MRITTYEGEKSVSALAGRLFRVGRAGSRRISGKVEAALIAANPALRDLDRVEEGTLIVVPDVPGVEKKAPSGDGSTGGDLAGMLMGSIERIETSIGDVVSAQSSANANKLRLLKSRRLKGLAEKEEALEGRLRAATADAEAERVKLKALRKIGEEAILELRDDLTEFIARHT